MYQRKVLDRPQQGPCGSGANGGLVAGSWDETTLHAFLGSTDGVEPLDDHVAVNANGDIFGSASAGGNFDFNLTHCAGSQPGGCGVVFEVQQQPRPA
jgi:hypothetical protein